MRYGGMARRILTVAARIVPAAQRREWRAEWDAELWAVERAGLRSPVVFCLGAVRHALWHRRREWTADQLAGDVRHALRSLARSPGFLVVASVTLALGVGANAVVFSLLNGLVLRAPAGIAEPGRIVQIGRGQGDEFDNWSYPYVRQLREGTRDVFEGLAAWTSSRAILGAGVDARAVSAHVVSGEYFRVLGVRPAVGRLLEAEDDRTGRPVVVLSYALWQSMWAGDQAIVGRTVTVDGESFEVVGVAARGFAGADALREPAALWAPLARQAALTGRAPDVLDQWDNSWLWVFARRAPGVDGARARVAVEAAHARIMDAHPESTQPGIRVASGVGVRPGDRAEVMRLGALLVAVMLLVLCIACANLAGLVLARGAARRGAVAVRTALGAGRGRIVRQVFAENLLIGVCGALLATVLAGLLASVLPLFLPVAVSVGFAPDARVFAFTALVTLFAVMLFGVAPALAASRADPARMLSSAGMGRGAAVRTGRLRKALVPGQVALAFVLLCGATLLLRSVRNALVADPGFRTSDVVVVTVDVARSLDIGADARNALRAALVDRIARVTGVTGTGLATVLPIAEFQPNRTPLPPGAGQPAGPVPAPVYTNTVDAGYFDALDIRTVAGRTFAGDADASAVVVNQRFAARFFPADDAVGAPVPLTGLEDARIVGVVADAAVRRLGEVPPAVLYVPVERTDPGAYYIVIATARDDSAIRAAIGAAIAEVEPRLPLLRVESLDRLVGASLGRTRLAAGAIAAAGALALLLSVIGLYGVIACAVVDRRREFGLRLAVGATRRDIIRLVVRQGVVLGGVGILLGVVLSAAGLRALEGLLFGVRPGDPATLVTIGLLLAVICVGACAAPAVSAARTDLSRTLGA